MRPGQGQALDQISINTSVALRAVLTKFPKWVESLKDRLANPKDWSSAESALAEIRAGGALLRARSDVQLGQTNKAGGRADFLLKSTEQKRL
jgi:hypothetical protein